jgi:hypothetical protein
VIEISIFPFRPDSWYSSASCFRIIGRTPFPSLEARTLPARRGARNVPLKCEEEARVDDKLSLWKSLEVKFEKEINRGERGGRSCRPRVLLCESSVLRPYARNSIRKLVPFFFSIVSLPSSWSTSMWTSRKPRVFVFFTEMSAGKP